MLAEIVDDRTRFADARALEGLRPISAAATRHLFNKLLGQLPHRLQHKQTFDGVKPFCRCTTLRPNATAVPSG